MDQWGDLTSLSWLHNVKILPNVDQQDSVEKSKENITPPESTLRQLLKEQEKGNASTINKEAEPLPIRAKSASTSVKINFSSPPQLKVVAKKSKAVSGEDTKPSSQLTTKDCQQLLFRILNDKRNVLAKQERDDDGAVDEHDEVASDIEEDEEEEDNEDPIKMSRKEESNLFRSLSEEAKKQILTKKIQIQSKTSVKSLCLHFSSLTKVFEKENIDQSWAWAFYPLEEYFFLQIFHSS